MAAGLREARGGPIQFSQEAWAELRKVTWPSRETVVRLTIIVMIISVIIAAYIFVFDNIFTTLITRGVVGGAPSPTPGP